MASAQLLLPEDNVDLQPIADSIVSPSQIRAVLSRAFGGSMRNSRNKIVKAFASSTSARPQVKSCLGRKRHEQRYKRWGGERQ